MPNIAAILKDEIRRLARREVRRATEQLRKKTSSIARISGRQRKEISALQEEISRLRKLVMADRPAPIAAGEEEVDKARLGPRSIRAQRRRLKLTQSQYAKLVGVSPPTILAWEKGKAAPRREKLAALIGVRRITPAEARKRLGLPPPTRMAPKRKKRKKRAKAKK